MSRKFDTVGGQKGFKWAVRARKLDGTGWEVRKGEILAKNKDHARDLIIRKFNKEVGSANWEWL